MAVGRESAFTDAARWAATERVVEPSPAWVDPVQERYHRFLELASLR
jgi:xylulokinase